MQPNSMSIQHPGTVTNLQSNYRFGSNKSEYYARRNVVRPENIPEKNHDVPDTEGQKMNEVPVLKHKESNYQSYYSDKKMSNIHSASIRQPTNLVDYETLYLKEQQSKKGVEDELKNISETNQKLQENKDLMKMNYEEFIAKLEAEISQLKQYEGDYNNLDGEKRKLEEEVKRLQLEISLFKKNSTIKDDALVDSLKDQIRNLNKDKLELLNNLEIQRNEVKNLKTVNYFENNNKEEDLIHQLTEANDKIFELEQKLANANNISESEELKRKDLRIKELELELNKMAGELEEAKKNAHCKECETKKVTVNYVKSTPYIERSPHIIRTYSPSETYYEKIREIPTTNIYQTSKPSYKTEYRSYSTVKKPTQRYSEIREVRKAQPVYEYDASRRTSFVDYYKPEIKTTYVKPVYDEVVTYPDYKTRYTPSVQRVYPYYGRKDVFVDPKFINDSNKNLTFGGRKERQVRGAQLERDDTQNLVSKNVNVYTDKNVNVFTNHPGNDIFTSHYTKQPINRFSEFHK